MWPNKPPFRRAARWDGVFPIDPVKFWLPPEAFAEIVAYVRRHRADDVGWFDVICSGETSGTDREADARKIQAYAEAGVTWWLESIWFDQHERIRRGPPRV